MFLAIKINYIAHDLKSFPDSTVKGHVLYWNCQIRYFTEFILLDWASHWFFHWILLVVGSKIQ